jgi:pilus assembly protein Flp/PilA
VSSVPGQTYSWLRQAVQRLRSEEKGQGMVEYALILVLVALVVIVILTITGGQVSNTFSNVSNGLNAN